MQNSNAELDDFFNGKGTVNLQPSAMIFGSPTDSTATPTGSLPTLDGSTTTPAGAFAYVKDMLGKAGERLPMLFVMESFWRFMSKAQPWKDFAWPYSKKPANEWCSRLSANIYLYQTNYAVLLAIWIVSAVIMDGTALFVLVLLAAGWYFFLTKNEDPNWQPEIGGVKLGPMQRVSLLGATTAFLLLFFAGGTIVRSFLTYSLIAVAHGILHDCPSGSLPTSQGAPDPESL